MARKVGILGSGDVGKRLGSAFIQLGHQVKIGTREPSRKDLREWASAGGRPASVGSFREAAAFGDLLVLATNWGGTENAIQLAGPENFRGKLVLDATNPLRFHAQGQPPTLALGHTDSAGEQVQRWLPEARVVKVFNIVGNPHMFQPEFPGGPPDMFICGNDAAAKHEVTDFLNAFGWPAIDLGGIEAARYLEPLAMVWILYGFRTGTWNHAFKLLRK